MEVTPLSAAQYAGELATHLAKLIGGRANPGRTIGTIERDDGKVSIVSSPAGSGRDLVGLRALWYRGGNFPAQGFDPGRAASFWNANVSPDEDPRKLAQDIARAYKKQEAFWARKTAAKGNPKMESALKGYLSHDKGTKDDYKAPKSLTRHVEQAMKQGEAEQVKALKGILHHNKGTKREYQLPRSLIEHVKSALKAKTATMAERVAARYAAKKPSEDPAYRGKDVTKWSQRDHNKRVEALVKKDMGDLMGLQSLIGIEIGQAKKKDPKSMPSLSLIEMHIDSAIKRKKKEKKAATAQRVAARYVEAGGDSFKKVHAKAQDLGKMVAAIQKDASEGRYASIDNWARKSDQLEAKCRLLVKALKAAEGDRP